MIILSLNSYQSRVSLHYIVCIHLLTSFTSVKEQQKILLLRKVFFYQISACMNVNYFICTDHLCSYVLFKMNTRSKIIKNYEKFPFPVLYAFKSFVRMVTWEIIKNRSKLKKVYLKCYICKEKRRKELSNPLSSTIELVIFYNFTKGTLPVYLSLCLMVKNSLTIKREIYKKTSHRYIKQGWFI